jgi:hypothetical protein
MTSSIVCCHWHWGPDRASPSLVPHTKSIVSMTDPDISILLPANSILSSDPRVAQKTLGSDHFMPVDFDEISGTQDGSEAIKLSSRSHPTLAMMLKKKMPLLLIDLIVLMYTSATLNL